MSYSFNRIVQANEDQDEDSILCATQRAAYPGLLPCKLTFIRGKQNAIIKAFVEHSMPGRDDQWNILETKNYFRWRGLFLGEGEMSQQNQESYWNMGGARCQEQGTKEHEEEGDMLEQTLDNKGIYELNSEWLTTLRGKDIKGSAFNLIKAKRVEVNVR